ncbi:hypothetical protein NMG60_11006441 [Bertholletia excelsa]
MVCFHISVPVDQEVEMAKSANSAGPCSKFRNKRTINSQNHKNIPDCHRSRSAVIDVFILIAVIGACGFLLFPYVKLLLSNTFQLVGEISGEIVDVVSEEVSRAPLIYGCLALSILCAVIAALAITECSRKCGKPGCRGLHKAAEFDIQIETADCLKNSNVSSAKDGVKKGLFELPRDHHRELEAELKKMAPPNGRAVLVFRARCGCSVGRMEVPGPKKPRKEQGEHLWKALAGYGAEYSPAF